MTTSAPAAIEAVLDKDELAAALKAASKFVAKGATGRVQNMIHLVGTKDGLTVESSNAASWLRTAVDVPGGVDERVDILVAPVIADAVASLPAGKATLEFHEQKVVVKGARRTVFELSASWDAYPNLPFPEDEDSVRWVDFDTSELFEPTGMAGKFASKDEKRPQVNGVSLRVVDDEVRAWSTDSLRFANVATDLDKGVLDGVDGEAITLPLRIGGDLRGLLSKRSSLSFGNNLLIRSGGITYGTRIVGEPFPNLTAVTPKEEDWVGKIKFDRGEAARALDRIAVLGSDAAALKFMVRDGEVVVKSTSVSGSAEEAWDADTGAVRMDLYFNLGFLREGLGSMKDGEVSLALRSELHPVLFVDEADSIRYLLMPVPPTASSVTGTGSDDGAKGGGAKSRKKKKTDEPAEDAAPEDDPTDDL